jgi:hypothetical protein
MSNDPDRLGSLCPEMFTLAISGLSRQEKAMLGSLSKGYSLQLRGEKPLIITQEDAESRLKVSVKPSYGDMMMS